MVSYLSDPTIQSFNFFKVNPQVITAQITEYVRNCLAGRDGEQLEALERTFAEEVYFRTQADDEVVLNKKQQKKADKEKEKKMEQVPQDILLNERINAKVF